MREMLQDFIERWRAIDFTQDDWRNDVHSFWESFSYHWKLNPFLDEKENSFSVEFLNAFNIRLEVSLGEFKQSLANMIAASSAIPPALFQLAESSSRSAAREISDSIKG